MNEYIPGLVWLVILLIVNAFFVGAEFAVISARRSQIEPRAAAGNRAAQTTLWAMEHATLMLATSQLGITVCSLLILNVSEPSIKHLLEVPLAWTGLTPAAVTGVAFGVALVLVTFLHVVFGEMIPKNMAFSVPDRAALLLAPPLVLVSKVVGPLIRSLNWIANGILRACRVQPKNEAASAFTIEEVANIVAQSTQEGTLNDSSGTLSAAFGFTETTVATVALPFDALVVLPTSVTPRAVQLAVATYGFSRFVIAEPHGEPVRYIHLKDVLDLSRAELCDAPIPKTRFRTLTDVHPDTDLKAALEQMRADGSHIARVTNELSKAPGVVFLEDIVEELIGEVQDATRREDPQRFH